LVSELENLCGANKPLRKEPPDSAEIAGLVESGRVRLTDAKNHSLSLASRFDLAYNASHALSLAALRYHGYRSTNRYIVFQALEHTLNLRPEVWRVLAKCHDLRNRGEYEGDLDVTDRLLQDPIRTMVVVPGIDSATADSRSLDMPIDSTLKCCCCSSGSCGLIF